MATTTNYGWVTPDNTALVKDGALAIRTLGSSVDTTTKALNPSTTLGDVEYRSSTANTNTRLGIGSTGQVLTVAGGVPTWATPAGSSGPAFRAFRSGSEQTITENTQVKVQFNSETFDTDSCYDPTTNYRFTPNKAGYYAVTCQIGYVGSGNFGQISIYKNGSQVSVNREDSQEGFGYSQVVDLISMNGSTDYLEGFAYIQASAATERVVDGSPVTFFNAVWIRSN